MVDNSDSKRDQVDDSDESEENHGSAIYRIAKDIVRERVDNPRGIFTESDREFLADDKQYEHKQSRSNKLRDIRERVTNGILDLQGLLSLPSDQQEKILSGMELGEFHESVAALIAFAYTGLDENIGAIEQMVESGLYRATQLSRESGDRPIEHVEVDINVVYGHDADEIYERWKRGDGVELTPAEIGILVREGKLEPEDYRSLKTGDGRRQGSSRHPDELPWYHDTDKD